MRQGVDYIPRRAADLVLEALEDTRIVVVNGARQVGKSTLAERILHRSSGGVANFLDDPHTRESAQADPVGFLRHEGLMLIDEVQRVPDLWLAMKYLVDRDPRPGRFLLTGSARLLALRSVPDTLPGRTETIELWPLSQGEIESAPDGFVDAAYVHGAEPDAYRAHDADTPPPCRAGYLDRATRGGFPEAVRRQTPRRRERFFQGYVADLVSRDIKQVAEIEKVNEFRRLLALLAGQQAGLVNIERLANELGVNAGTVSNYLAILETVFVIRVIPAWSSGATRRATGTPKVIFVDTGLSGHLASGLITDQTTGGLLENFVLSELARQLTWARGPVRLYHYRDRDGYEVDGVLEDNAGQIVGIEVKCAETVRQDDLRGLSRLRRQLGDRFRAGFVLYCGDRALGFGDRLACVPISALWTTPSPFGTEPG